MGELCFDFSIFNIEGYVERSLATHSTLLTEFQVSFLLLRYLSMYTICIPNSISTSARPNYKTFFSNYPPPIPWRDSISRLIALVYSMAGGDDTTRPRRQGHIVKSCIWPIVSLSLSLYLISLSYMYICLFILSLYLCLFIFFSLSFSLYLYLFLFIFFSLSSIFIFMSLSLSLYLISLSLSLYLCLFILSLYLYLFILSLYLYLFIFVSLSLSLYLISLSLSFFISLSLCLFIFVYLHLHAFCVQSMDKCFNFSISFSFNSIFSLFPCVFFVPNWTICLLPTFSGQW
jgi:hypothetical protein